MNELVERELRRFNWAFLAVIILGSIFGVGVILGLAWFLRYMAAWVLQVGAL
jgi:hypothetical protein